MVYEKMDTEQELLERLKLILLQEDRQELERLREILTKPEELSPYVTPLIEEKLNFFKQNFPDEFQLVVKQLIDQRLQESKEELLNIIYPEMGTMIRKFIALQFQQLQESIDERLNAGFLGKIRAYFSKSETIINDLNISQIEEVFIIQRFSGLLIATASRTETVNRDVVAGMLTAIKAFVEDAFTQKSEELEMIQYGTYSILLYNFRNYYLALAITGTPTASQRDKLYGEIFAFAKQELAMVDANMNENQQQLLAARLRQYFLVEKS